MAQDENETTRNFYVELAYAWPGAARYVTRFPLTLEHEDTTDPVLFMVDSANGGLVAAVTLETSVHYCQHGEPVSVSGDLLWAAGEALAIVDETLGDYLEEKGADVEELPEPHRVNVVHTGGLLDAMRNATEGLPSKRQAFEGDDEGEVVGS